MTENGKIVYEGSDYLGIRTNNYAEYRGLIAGISKVIELKGREAEFVMDSQLVIRQMKGEYKVRSPDMKPLHDDAVALASLIPTVRYRNVRRSEELIPRADALVNQTLDRHRGTEPVHR